MRESNKGILFSEEGISATVGFLLIVAIMMAMTATIYAVAYPILWDTQERSYAQNVQQSFIVMSSNINRIISDKTPSQSIEIQTMDASISSSGSSTMNITWTNSTGALDCWEEYPNCTTFNLLTIEHTKKGRTIAYEGGGVWEKYLGGGVAVLSNPSISTGTVTMIPVAVIIGGTASAGGGGMVRITVDKTGESTIIEEDNVFDIQLNITSEHCKGWEHYFEIELGKSTTGGCTGNSVVANLGNSSRLLIVQNYLEADISVGR